MVAGDGDGDGGGAHLVFAYYVTGHGPGHATRAVEVVRQLLAAGHAVHVVTAAPDLGVTIQRAASPRLHIRQVEQVVLDCIAEPYALTVDRSASKAVVPRASILKRDAEWLQSIDADLVVLNPWSADEVSDVLGMDGPIGTTALLSEYEVVRGREETPSPRPRSKRHRGSSLPPSSTSAKGGYQRRSSSSPPSPERARSGEDKTLNTAEATLSPMAVFWDIENCRIPRREKAEAVSKNIRKALSMNADVASTTIKAYGAVSEKTVEELQRAGVGHVNTLNRRKDAADKLILVDMFIFALDNPPPASILLISGDGDFAPAVRVLAKRGYTIVIAIPSQATASAALTNAGTYVWDWPCLARGKGIVIPGSLPVDPAVLKTQMIQLFKSHGGYIDLSRVVHEYKKQFGKQLNLANYDVTRLLDMFKNMGYPFFAMDNTTMVFLDQQLPEDQASTSATTVGSEVPTSLVADVLFANTEEDPYGFLEDEIVEEMITGASSLEGEPNELRINKTVFIGKNLNEELEKAVKD